MMRLLAHAYALLSLAVITAVFVMQLVPGFVLYNIFGIVTLFAVLAGIHCNKSTERRRWYALPVSLTLFALTSALDLHAIGRPRPLDVAGRSTQCGVRRRVRPAASNSWRSGAGAHA